MAALILGMGKEIYRSFQGPSHSSSTSNGQQQITQPQQYPSSSYNNQYAASNSKEQQQMQQTGQIDVPQYTVPPPYQQESRQEQFTQPQLVNVPQYAGNSQYQQQSRYRSNRGYDAYDSEYQDDNGRCRRGRKGRKGIKGRIQNGPIHTLVADLRR